MNDEERKAVTAKLEQAAAKYAGVTAAREELHAAIVEALQAGMGPSMIEKLVPYDRQHIDRIRRSAGIPAKRRPTVRRIEPTDP